MLLLATTGGWAQTTIGADAEPAEGALLDLKEWSNPGGGETSGKGVLLPRVKLQKIDELKPLITTDPGDTEKQKYKGTVVYNVATVDNFKEGIYHWDGESWVPMEIEFTPEVKSVQTVPLLNNTGGEIDTSRGFVDGRGGTELDFGTIIIPETGAYAFCLRLYGSIQGLITVQRLPYYLSLWKDNSSDPNNLKDLTELNMYARNVSNEGDLYSYTITLSAGFNKGDKVKFKLAHLEGITPKTWRLWTNTELTAQRTSMIWWRL